MRFDKEYTRILENMGRDMMSAQMAGNRQLIYNLMNNPGMMLDFIKKTPGMYADLLSGRMEQLSQKFKQFGVDYEKIANQVDQARRLLNREKAGGKVPVKKALPVTENVQVDHIMDYFFEDLYNNTNDRQIMDEIRRRIETPEFQKQVGPAAAGDLVERIFYYIKKRRKK